MNTNTNFNNNINMNNINIPTLTDSNPLHDQAYRNGSTFGTFVQSVVLKKPSVAISVGCAQEFFNVPSVCGKTTQAVSDQAWDMMKFYDAHGLDQEMLDHDMQMRHGCNIF